jgi:hypothetical protein
MKRSSFVWLLLLLLFPVVLGQATAKPRIVHIAAEAPGAGPGLEERISVSPEELVHIRVEMVNLKPGSLNVTAYLDIDNVDTGESGIGGTVQKNFQIPALSVGWGTFTKGTDFFLENAPPGVYRTRIRFECIGPENCDIQPIRSTTIAITGPGTISIPETNNWATILVALAITGLLLAQKKTKQKKTEQKIKNKEIIL